MTFLSQYWADLSQLFSNSQQRLFWGYWCCAIAVAIIFWLKDHYFTRSTTDDKAIHKLGLVSYLGLKHFISRSAVADYQLIVINKAIFLLLSPYLLTKLVIATAIFEYLHTLTTPLSFYTAAMPTSMVVVIFTIWLFLLDDFARFYFHKIMHDIPWLWQFHKVHHSATSLTPLSVLRTHPIEGLIFALRSAFVQGISISVFIFCFGSKVDLYTLLNVNIFVFIFNVAGSNLRHSHVAISYWPWLEKLIISPSQHHIHHSTNPVHFNKNYGAILAIWDNLANTLCLSKKGQRLNYGLNKHQCANEHQLLTLYLSPFIHIYRSITQYLKRRTDNKVEVP
jgi:sterol desaturase/sphingolipid hydroxylase (fatty acid hydroxylase superfamily)